MRRRVAEATRRGAGAETALASYRLTKRHDVGQLQRASRSWPLYRITEGAGGWGVGVPSGISNLEKDMLASARVVGEVAPDSEQYRNDIVHSGCVESNLHVLQNKKKAPERGRHHHQGAAADGRTRAMYGASRDPGGPSLSIPPLVPSQLLALHQLPQRTQVQRDRHGSVRGHGGRRTKRQHRAPALAAAREVTTSEGAPATRGAPGHGRSGPRPRVRTQDTRRGRGVHSIAPLRL
jgi:hypothetical protein